MAKLIVIDEAQRIISFQLGSEKTRKDIVMPISHLLALITLTKYYDHYLSKSILLAVQLNKYFFFHQ